MAIPHRSKINPVDVEREIARLRAIERGIIQEMRNLHREKNMLQAQADHEHVREMLVNLRRQISFFEAKIGARD